MSFPTTLEPASGDTAVLAARKSNQLLWNTYRTSLGLPPYPGGLTTLAPTRNDSLALALKKINAILALQAGAPPDPLFGPWVAASYQSGYSGNLFARWILSPTAMLAFNGSVSTSTTFPPGTPVLVGQVPTGVRPTATRRFIIPMADAAGVGYNGGLSLNAGGNLLIIAGTGSETIAYLDGVTCTI